MRFVTYLIAAFVASFSLTACASWTAGDARDFILVEDIRQVPDSDPFALREVRIESDSLKFKTAYGGGCREHDFTLYAARSPEKANEVFLYIQHNANHDMCRAWIEGAAGFDLRGLKRALRLSGVVTLRSAPNWSDSAFAVEY